MSAATPDTIVLVHGFWMTPRSWEHWKARYEAAGYTVLTPAYPGLEVEVEALNEDPTPIAELTVPKIIEHLESVIEPLANPPIIMGHSAGGAFTQILLDHGYGAAGVTLNSAPTEGVLQAPFSQLRSVFPVLRNPANRHKAVPFTYEQFVYAFTNGAEESVSRQAFERYVVPVNRDIVLGGVTGNLKPGHQDTWVDYHNESRAPLLFISGSEDHIMPPSVQQSNAKHYKAEGTITEVEEVEGPHFMVGLEGWEAIADRALEWALANAKQPAPAA
ncbi:MAG: alpha/beta hydrolase [Solirubrobacteraceae bacterium]|nr:alpha/beta hydrolase [Solirubrobacteraceae bacterium]